ncbi:hypothetical protein N7497_005248 [Penicillium chrysogenum]|nr:hypothetical protein N7497_005248 [Penicillium chrysogenum]
MAKTKGSTTPKAKEAKETKPAKSGIAKRTPVEALSVKLSRAKSVVPSEDMLFMWKIVQVSVMEIDWPAMAKDTGMSVGTLQKRWYRLRTRIQQYLSEKKEDSSPKRSHTKADSVVLSEDLLFMWKIMQMSVMDINWPAMAKDTGISVGTLQKRWYRLRVKIQQYLSAVSSSESSGKGTNSSDTNKDVDGSESPKKDIDSTETDEDVDSSKSPKKDPICSE